MFWLLASSLFLVIVGSGVYRKYLRNRVTSEPPVPFSYTQAAGLKSILQNDTVWNKYEKKYDNETVRKRRDKMRASYNELTTLQNFSTELLPGWLAFDKRVTSIKNNPAKAFACLLLPLTLGFYTVAAQTTSKDWTEKGNLAYKNKDYQQALTDYRQALTFKHTPKTTGGIHYKIALTFQKLSTCDSAVVHFRDALNYDPEDGGASSLEKFREKARACGFSGEENTVSESPGILPEKQASPQQEGEPQQATDQNKEGVSEYMNWLFGLPVVLVVSFLCRILLSEMLANLISGGGLRKQKLAFDALAFDDTFWNGQLQKGFPPVRVEQVKSLFQQTAGNLAKIQDYKAMQPLIGILNSIQQQPELYFSANAFSEGYARFLLAGKEVSFYCFFTSEYLESGKSNVCLIRHPARPELNKKVWVSDKVQRQLEKGSRPKVRLHPVNGVYVHWSDDESFFQFTKSHLDGDGNLLRMDTWQGEASEVSFDTYYNIFTDPFMSYLFPGNDTIDQAEITYQGKTEQQKTGYDSLFNTGITLPDTSLDNLATGMMLGNMTTGRNFDNDDTSRLRDNS
jgi:hypothetical protein